MIRPVLQRLYFGTQVVQSLFHGGGQFAESLRHRFQCFSLIVMIGMAFRFFKGRFRGHEVTFHGLPFIGCVAAPMIAAAGIPVNAGIPAAAPDGITAP